MHRGVYLYEGMLSKGVLDGGLAMGKKNLNLARSLAA